MAATIPPPSQSSSAAASASTSPVATNATASASAASTSSVHGALTGGHPTSPATSDALAGRGTHSVACLTPSLTSGAPFRIDQISFYIKPTTKPTNKTQRAKSQLQRSHDLTVDYKFFTKIVLDHMWEREAVRVLC
uniref:Uncharacterized protein n=1 Tax=Leersia perrieri TaxID=77586 RepID=A0A0D9WCN5_9ORYZ